MLEFILIMNLKSISLHPKFAGVLDLLVGLFFLWGINLVKAPWMLGVWFVARILVWLILIRLVYYPENIKRFWHLLTVVVFHLGVSSLLLFVEWQYAWILVGLVYLLLPLISFWLLPTKGDNLLSFVMKPYRRWRFWMTVFGIFGIWVATFAAIALKIFDFSYWILLLAGTIFTSLVSFWWWAEYQLENNKKLWIWLLALTIFIFEISWVFTMWPLGYFVSATLTAWWWYDIWLLGRFHMSPAGINWRKQNVFLILNGILLIIFLGLIVQWR